MSVPLVRRFQQISTLGLLLLSGLIFPKENQPAAAERPAAAEQQVSPALLEFQEGRSRLHIKNKKEAKAVPHFEISFGQGKMFIGDTALAEIRKKRKVVLPTSSALFLGEYIASDSWSAFLAFNLPISSQQFIVNGELVDEPASPFLGLGPVYAAAHLNVYNRLVLEPQLGVLGGTVFRRTSGLHPAAVLAGRIHIATPDGFTMYIGLGYTIGVEAVMLLYGAGHRF